MLSRKSHFRPFAFRNIGSRSHPAADVSKVIFERSDLQQDVQSLAAATLIAQLKSTSWHLTRDYLAQRISNGVDLIGWPINERRPCPDQFGLRPADHPAKGGVDISLLSFQIDDRDTGGDGVLDGLPERGFRVEPALGTPPFPPGLGLAQLALNGRPEPRQLVLHHIVVRP